MTMRSEPVPGRCALLLAGDVMIGRGIDQILRHPVDPVLHEPGARSALEYVALAERANGPLPRGVDDRYVWGDVRGAIEDLRPDARIVNLETAVTSSDRHWPGKGIHYRVHPANVGCLAAAGIDCCVLANNHVLDWGRAGLAETLATLHAAGLRTAGAGRDAGEAAAPAILPLPGGGRVLVYAAGTPDSGIPADWSATAARSGVNLLDDLAPRRVDAIARQVQRDKRPGDVAVFSIHWGGNWGYEIPAAQQEFAHRLVDAAGIAVVHGHSSHHAKGIEVRRGRPILYGCGDLLDDYEGIGGYERYRADLGFLYLACLDPRAGLAQLRLVPTAIRRFRVNRATAAEADWLARAIGRESGRMGTRLERRDDGTLALR